LVCILAISPHTDDAELGCGGTLYKLSQSGAKVYILAVCSPTQTLRLEFKAATKVLGASPITWDYSRRYFDTERQDILDSLIDLRDKIHPDIVFAPCETDSHQDHKTIFAETERAYKYSYGIYTSILPWNVKQAQTLCYSLLTQTQIDVKLSALACYRSQVKRHYFNPENVLGMARDKGLACRTEYAEAFGVVRCFI